MSATAKLSSPVLPNGLPNFRKMSGGMMPPYHPHPAPSPRRQRCLSCNEGNYLDIDIDQDEETVVPDVLLTRRTRTDSICERIEEDVESGTVKYFCRSRGHGLIKPDKDPHTELFMHISDIEGEFVPQRGDKVTFRLCPLPPRFEQFQAVHVHIVDLDPETHRRWDNPETPEEIEEDKRIKTLPYDV